ncbi:hypothetical protein AF335_14250 [Streptomyces eurocidicus]|uniref:Uncharacterized protein n=1 Tax=Streptomyces eurocidicus TaxID=66423 RepID=A0A2N8NVB6_STREU|nr:hypothetical protein [Streptomyces eurocidicus]MBB5122988.1 hypothetical protein [Streptomyces eurocidicus]MBF6056557.1 hypothetical protein [Streptomyces eurocidicus]PNE32725.1 hypothetical protein AF335_14250 [Streptomyces eurocidicus]
MNLPRRTTLLVSGALCGALAVTTAATARPPAEAPTPAPARASAPPAEARVPSPEALRKAAAEGAKAIDSNFYTQAARRILDECEQPQAAGARPGPSCVTVKKHLGALATARATLEQQSRAAAPDLTAITTATTDAVAATAHLAKGGVTPADPSPGRSPAAGPGARAAGGFVDGSDGLLPVVTRLVGGLVNTLGGLVSGLVGGLLRGLLSS